MQHNSYSSKTIQAFLACMVLFLNTYFLQAQRVETFSNLEGFNQNTVSTIEQDSYGFLWIGTPNGLIKYDGYDFENVRIDFNNYITTLHSDKNNHLWIGNNEGAVVKVLSLEKEYKVPIPKNFRVSHIRSDANDNIWISGENKLFVCKLLDKHTGTFELSENLLEKHKEIETINDFVWDKTNSMILATSGGLLQLKLNNTDQLSAKTITSVITFEDFDYSINSIQTIGNNLWVGTTKGFFKVSTDDKKVYILKDFNKDAFLVKKNLKLIIKNIYEDRKGTVWICTQNEGLFHYVPETEKYTQFKPNLNNDSGVSSQIINCIYEDEFDVMWIGTGQGGLNKLNSLQKPFYSYQRNPFNKKALAGNLTTAILEDSRGYLWVSTYNNSVCRSTKAVNDNNVANIKFNSLKNIFPLNTKEIVRSIYEDSYGYIWFGTEFSIICYNPKTDRFKKLTLKKNNRNIKLGLCFAIQQLDKNTLLFGGHTFVTIKNPWEQILKRNKDYLDIEAKLDLPNNRAYKVLLDNQQKLWLGTETGLILLNYENEKLAINKDYKYYRLKNINHSKVFTLKEDANGYLWEGTFGGGLNKIKFDAQNEIIEYKSYNKNNLLNDNAVYGILQDDNQNLWLSTDMGLCKFNTDTEEVNFFDVRDGLINNNFRQSSYFKGKSGYFYFGGLNGLTVFDPEKINLNLQLPKVIFTKLKVKNKKAIIENDRSNSSNTILTKSISETSEISIHENDQILALDVIVDHSANPTKNKLAYKLEGFNNDWIIENTGKATITYTNLSPGNYELKIKGANSDGIWSEQIKSLKIKVLPPWYKTWWSYLLFVLLIILISVGITIYFVQHEKLKQRLLYEQLDKERLDTINQGKFRYFTNISHEFRTPLTLIAGPLEHIISMNKDADNTKYLAIIQKNTKRLLSLVDQLITFRKAEQGHVKLKLSQNTLGDFIYPTTEAFENYAVEKNINFFYKVNSPNENIIIDTEKVERIIFNLLSNAFKNTPANGSVSIESDIITNGDTKMIQIDVIDNGKGIPAKDLDNIFERFYQLGNNEESVSGGGIGLAFCKSLINLLEGQITVKSEPFVETRFSILIPAKTIEDYKNEEVNTHKKSFIKDWVPLSTEFKNETFNNELNNTQKEHHLLIVEDEEDVQHFLVSRLSKQYNITIANNGLEGLEKVKLNEPTLIISDVMMPEMDGFAFCEHIKSTPETCHIPVVLLTALGENEDAIKGLEFGADEYISKPFSIKLLELRIKKLIDNNIRLKEYFSKNSVVPKKGIEISTRDKEFLNEIIAVIEENIADSNFGVETLSAKMNLSASHFYRRLKQLTGQIPNAYIRNFRLQRAAELMSKNDGANVTEIMYQIGIESNSYFSTSFKKLHGVSPSEFLKNLSN
ncbi:hybrid sensor histidine kinase/response regulator transcription factor [Flavicella sediminum]|uniref:hybrid sensor histidine kinase/response regulator transcription factor n=1 Tax=Flavicella sediminum TaxID=2585141 RepID=UPI00111E44A1|nr:hybrid sensor histidine kinase/response regulator transcription factor [Flavicella sediminum]